MQAGSLSASIMISLILYRKNMVPDERLLRHHPKIPKICKSKLKSNGDEATTSKSDARSCHRRMMIIGTSGLIMSIKFVGIVGGGKKTSTGIIAHRTIHLEFINKALILVAFIGEGWAINENF